MDRFFRVVGFEEEQLGYYAGGDGFVDGAVEAYYSFLEWNSCQSKWFSDERDAVFEIVEDRYMKQREGRIYLE